MKDEANPLGEVIVNEVIENYVNELKKEWDANKESVPWYKIWYKISMSRVTNFIMDALDNLMGYVDDLVEKGADKKATVIAAIETLYDYVIREAMPMWLRPLSGVIKRYIINYLVSNAIDWMVEKYREGSWKMKKGEENAVQALWAAGNTAGKIGS